MHANLSKQLCRLVLAAVAAGLVVGIGAGAGPAVAASPSCSPAVAEAVATRLRWGYDPALRKTPIFQVLCGEIFGRGSSGMVVSIAVPAGCGGSIGWGVFRYGAGGWRLVLDRHNGAFLSLTRFDIRERQGAPKPNDPPCSPSVWKSRTWHWNGSRFTVGAWKVTPAADGGEGGSKRGYFKTPSGNIECDYAVDDYVRCGIKSGLNPAPRSRGPHCVQAPWLSLFPSAAAAVGPQTCPGEDEPDAGPFAGDRWADVWVLAYGKTWRGGRLSCASAFTGLTCRSSSGHGFFLSRERWRTF